MLNVKVLKCYRNKKEKTEKLRNTNMLDKCRNITGRKQMADIVLCLYNRCQLSQKLGLTPLSARDAA